MKKAFLSILLTFGLSIHADVVHRTGDLAETVYNNDQTTQTNTTQAGSNVNGSTVSTAPVTTSINPGAEKGRSSQSSGSAANAAVAAALLAACLAPCPTCAYPLCAMSALAAMQAGHDSNAAGESAATFAQSSTTPSVTATPGAFATGSSGFQDPALQKSLAKLSEGGYKLTSTGLVNPDGSVTPLSAFNSPSSMAAAGIDANSIAQMKKITEAAREQYGAGSPAAISGAVSSGGGGPSSIVQEPVDEDSIGRNFRNPFALTADQKKAMIAGKTVNFNGEPIGVAGSNIFDMVHVAYQKRRTGNQFIESEQQGVSTRAPASVTPYVSSKRK
jgi:hypothetical protein